MGAKGKNALIVCGYGCHITEELVGYLDKVVNLLLEERPEILILSGGATQKKSAPLSTEADAMLRYLLFLSPERENVFRGIEGVSMERNAFTSLENIKFSSEILREMFQRGKIELPLARIIIFCEATRAANVVMLARHFLLPFVGSIKDIMVETASWELDDPFKQAGNLIYNKIAITFPWLGLAELEHRRRVRRSYEI